MMLMRDSTRANLIPNDVPVIAGYADGIYQWKSTDWLLFPQSIKLSIATSASSSADILDVENGDATPDQTPQWCDRFNRPSRRRPTIYCNRSSWPLVRSALAGRMVDYWIATLDGQTKYIAGAVAVQYIDVNGQYDESVIADPTWVYKKLDPLILDMVVKGWYRFPPMNRNPLQSEVDFWVGKIQAGENPEATMDEFMASTEYQQKLAVLYANGYTDAMAVKAVATKLGS